MIIPKEIEDAVKLKEQQDFCAALCADIPDLIASKIEAVEHEQDQEPVHVDSGMYDAGFVVDSIRNEINRRVTRYGLNSMLNIMDMPCSINRPNVGVFSIDKNRFIRSADDLIDLFQEIKEIKLEKKYDGPDKNNVIVLRGKLPDNYVGCCAYVQARHIPISVFEEDKVVAKLVKNKLDQVIDVDLLCRDIPPLKSNQPYGYLGAEKVMIHYHWITVKISKETKAIQCWFPGTEKNVDAGRAKQMVLVGAHYKKKKMTPKPYGGFGSQKTQE